MCLGIRADSEWAASVTVVPVELDQGPGPQMDMGRGIRALRVAVTLELIVARHPRRALSASRYSRRQVRPGAVGWYPSGGCPRCPRDPCRAAMSRPFARA